MEGANETLSIYTINYDTKFVNMKKSKNILHLMGMESSKYGGIERFNVELSRQLAEKDYHSVFVYEEEPEVKQFVEDMKATGAEIVIINSRHHVLRFCKEFWKLLRQYNFCMMHAHFTKARFYAVPLAILYGIKNIVYTLHSTIEHLSKIKLHTRLWYKVFNKYCRIVAVSKDIENVSKQNWPNATIRNLYLGINPCVADREISRKNLGITKEQIMVMCTANFNHIKGLDVLVKAVDRLNKDTKLENVVFYIVGQTEKDKQELQVMIDSLHLTQYFHLEGISNAVPLYLNAADIYVQPSRNEGLPLALMEACSVGLPIVASRIGGIPEVAIEGENALLFDVENDVDCANAMNRLLANNEIREKFGARSFEIYQEEFMISNNVSKLIDYYQL